MLILDSLMISPFKYNNLKTLKQANNKNKMRLNLDFLKQSNRNINNNYKNQQKKL